MMKMRGGLLALLVLAIATVLMVFFVLPRLSNDTETKTEVAVPAKAPATTPEAKPAATAAPAVDPAAATAAASAKMGRLMREADGALKNLEGLFASGKLPAADAFAAAKGSAETALSALAATDLPDGIEQGAADAIAKARANAGKALDLLKTLPNDPQAAGAAIAAVAKALLGEEAAPSAAAATTPPAAASQTATETAAPSAPATPAAPSTPAANASETASAEKAVPKFDVLRVEPDGSTVIAGSAAPGTKVEIVDGGDKVLSSTEAGPTGDFAAVLDNPLPPGDHALALRSVDKSGAAVRSDEVATISVPEKAEGQLLAMISKPGEASRVITMPESVNTGDKQQRVAEQQPAATPVATPDLPPASSVLSTSAPSIPTDAAAAASGTTTAAPAPASAEPAEVQVTAVEIEGGRIFIAGTAPPSSKVRGYADDVLVGEATADASRHFVIEGTANLSVGGHTIRVDLLDATGQVSVRASVPFDRPAGEQVAVVAPADGTGAKSAALVPQDLTAFNEQRNALSRAADILSALYADGKKPTLDALAAARSSTELALKSLVEFRPLAEFAPTVARQVTATAESAGKALAALQAVPRDVDAMGNALPQIRAMIDDVLRMAPAAGTAQTAAQTAPAPANASTSSQAASAAGTAETAAPKTIEQAPLTASRDSVIIRQGDTLWQISRRVYGQGVRYTTIYLANEGQITNPDKIAPGQIFSVPSEALPNAEELHRRRLRGERID